MTYMETETKILSALKNIPKAYVQTLWIAFGLINLAFLFHTVNFMFGDHDWNYVRSANYWSEGAFEGRPLHFVLQSIFFGGEVLPILNNMLAFAALTLSGVLLAKYWQIPFSKLNYTLFTVFTAVLPYTLVWLFYAKDTLINLSLPLIGVCGLLAADYAVNEKRPLFHWLAIGLFYFAFASYVAVINLLCVCFIGNLMQTYANGKVGIIPLIKKKLWTAGDIFVSLICFKLTLCFLPVSSTYNTQVVAWEDIPQKLMETVMAMFAQFITPLPFMEYKFKLLLLLLCIWGFILLLYKGGKAKIIPQVGMLLLVLFASKTAFFLANEKGQILAQMENFAFVPRLDFYGLAYIYALGAAFILSHLNGKLRKAGVVLVIIIAFMSMVRDMYAQKVWKLGFDAEMKAHERIVARMEKLPNFDISRRYRLLQIGSLSMRENYYLPQPAEQISLDLLSTSFTPQFMSRIVYNFYYPRDIFYNNAGVEDLTPQGRDFLLTQAKPFPAQEFIFIDGDIVIIVLTEEGLAQERAKLYR